MSTISFFLENYYEIMESINRNGFHNAIIFKEFSNKEAHSLNILLRDKRIPEEGADSLLDCEYKLKQELTELLKCKIVLTMDTPVEIAPYYREKLNSSNSVKLTDNVPTEAVLRVFGNDWTFNPPVILASSCSESFFEQDVEEVDPHSPSKDDWDHHPDVLSLLWTTPASRRDAEENESSKDLEKADLMQKLQEFVT